MASKWDGIKSPKILDALRVALSDDKMFSHREVVDVIRAALDDGYLTPSELNDLRIVADNSETMLPRPRAMLRYLIEQTPKVYGAAGLFSLTTNRQQFAAETICSFLKRIGNGYFPHLDRDRVGIDLLLRVGNPEIINQDTARLCGPVAFVYGLASDSPGRLCAVRCRPLRERQGDNRQDRHRAEQGLPHLFSAQFDEPGGLAHGGQPARF